MTIKIGDNMHKEVYVLKLQSILEDTLNALLIKNKLKQVELELMLIRAVNDGLITEEDFSTNCRIIQGIIDGVELQSDDIEKADMIVETGDNDDESE